MPKRCRWTADSEDPKQTAFDLDLYCLLSLFVPMHSILSSPRRSPGRAIVPPPALGLVLAAAAALAKC